MISTFTDQEMQIIIERARPISADRRDIYLTRISAMMQFRPRTVADLNEVCDLASVGLCHSDGFVIPGPARGPARVQG